ncbi:MAG: rod shape-determining protein MreC [Candidatus Liptonbacteria bacterium]|nr:rod shape-determining protein MreC [Candidatus Liptonbacteria bacterium]
MRKKNVFLGILIFGLLVLILFNPKLGWDLRSFLAKEPGEETERERLTLENESLKAELIKLGDLKEQLPKITTDFTPALVYSRYPFNLKNEILLNAGRGQGIGVNQAVTLFVKEKSGLLKNDEILLGRIKEVKERTSLVTTIFDPEWKSEAKIGKPGVEALVIGGGEPRLTLIKKEAKIQEGEVVYSTDERFPYGLPLGEVWNIGWSKDQLFQEADLKMNYDWSQIKAVMVLKK